MVDSKRVDANSFEKMIDDLPKGELDRINQLQHDHAIREHNKFKEFYGRGECYLCGKPFKTISRNSQCIHSLLRRCKFKAKDFPKIYEKYDYHQISSFLRWVANEERFQGNINDLLDEKNENKLVEVTIQWKNIEWTFSCSDSDYLGHGRNSNYPHYHFQMRIDRKQFINFSQHHIRFSDKDLFNFDLLQKKPDLIRHTYGTGGSGMQDAVDVNPNDILEHMNLSNSEEDATYHLQTIIQAKGESIDEEEFQKMLIESKESGKPLASLADKYLGESAEIKTVVSPVDTIPDIAKRSSRKSK